MINDLLDKLAGVRRTGEGRYIALCPSHGDKHPSLAIRELNDGRILAHCFAGCGIYDIVASLGLELDALFPEIQENLTKGVKRPFSASDILRCVAKESSIVAIAASAMLNGETPTDEDRARLYVAAGRLAQAADMAFA